jgi:hypothetical protein
MELAIYISITTFILVVVGWTIEHFIFINGIKKDMASEFTSIRQDCSVINGRLIKLETQMDLWWNAIQDAVVKILHSPHSPELDSLLEKLEMCSLSDVELRELRNYLINLVDNKADTAIAAAILLANIAANERRLK